MTTREQIIGWPLYLIVLCLVFPHVYAWRRDVVAPKGFTLASNYFGLNLFNELSEQNVQKKNLFYSPYSVSMALSMLHQGSDGETAKQLETSLGYRLAKLDTSRNVLALRIENSTQEIFSPKNVNSSSYELVTGNALISDDSFPILEQYKENLKIFQAELFSENFANNSAAIKEMINSWCANKTNGKISTLLTEAPSPSTKMALINAIYFKGKWKVKFNPNQTTEGDFFGPNGNTFSRVQYMKVKDYFSVASLDEIESDMIELPYESEDLSFFAILPKDKNSDLQLIKKALNPWYVEAALSRLYSQEMELKMPKFNFKKEYQLVDVLKRMGIKDVFGLEANLSGISRESALAVDEIKHTASIEVNEEGSEAAAATYIGIVRLSLQVNTPTYIFDHPFLFFIRHNNNGQILLMGEVNQF